MAIKLDKDTLLEFLFKYRDQLIIVVLIGIAGYGAYSVWGQYNRSVEEIISDNLPQSRPGQSDDDYVGTAQNVVTGLLSKVPVAVYVRTNNPFGTPEQQLRLRQELDEAYQRALESFRVGNYQEAINILQREVIPQDVTETRIAYAISPSEIIRQAEIALTRANLDGVVTRANESYQAGKSSSDPAESLVKLRSALNDYQRVIEVDPQGNELGADRLKEIETRIAELTDTVNKMERENIRRTVVQARQDLASARNSGDTVNLLKSVGKMRAAFISLTSIDPDMTVVSQKDRETITTELQEAQKQALDALPTVIETVKTALTSTPPEQQDFDSVRSNLALIQECVLLAQANQNADLATQAGSIFVEFIEAFTGSMQKLVAQLDKAIKEEKYDQFDTALRDRFLEMATILSESGLQLPRGRINQLMDASSQLRALALPPLMSDAYDLVNYSATTRYHRITLRNKESGEEEKLNLQLDKKDSKGFILLEVDTNQGTIILSKSGYRPSRYTVPKE